MQHHSLERHMRVPMLKKVYYCGAPFSVTAKNFLDIQVIRAKMVLHRGFKRAKQSQQGGLDKYALPK